MDHDSKKTTRAQISAITVKITTETTLSFPPGTLESASKTEKKSTTYAIEPMTFETEEVRTLHGDPLPSGIDPSVEEVLKVLSNPVVQQGIGMAMGGFMAGRGVDTNDKPSDGGAAG